MSDINITPEVLTHDDAYVIVRDGSGAVGGLLVGAFPGFQGVESGFQFGDSVQQGLCEHAGQAKPIDASVGLGGGANLDGDSFRDGQIIGDFATKIEVAHSASPSADDVGEHSVGGKQVTRGADAPSVTDARDGCGS